ncbi:predicted protein [Sclerotinia sclerotiorum 1980 UF-70]|uniref:Uncharacterized protein n=1 Tax=Sclerotinia sclerotiorum (strain ATCC 18683 / 1980 / Ss-1) TaxID=665079 RepID=A7E9B0_SCLS1|nr:predicted protein [Sclerotinia sclerotiorum 1980 UF-70]EDN96962.1 predicted protein [Sclerotinia sclerotiorum 1980 UF-70]
MPVYWKVCCAGVKRSEDRTHACSTAVPSSHVDSLKVESQGPTAQEISLME